MTTIFARAVWVLAAGCAAHAGYRLAVLPTLGRDDAEIALFAQSWSWAYPGDNPPLYVWLVKVAQSLPIDGVTAAILVRFALLFGLLCLSLALAKRTIPDRSIAAPAGLAVLLIPPIGWESLEFYTHTLAGVFFTVATVLILDWRRLHGGVKSAAVLGAAAWGAAVGLGLLSKYATAPAFGLLILAALTLADWRKTVLAPSSIVALAVCGAVVIQPLLHATPWAPRPIGFELLSGSDTPWPAGAAAGLFAVANSVLDLALLPLVAVGACLTIGSVRDDRPPPSTALARLLRRWTILSMAVFLLVAATGALEKLETHHLLPILMFAPLTAAAALSAKRVGPRRGPRLLTVIGLAAGIAAAAFVVKTVADPIRCRRCYLHLPIDILAEDLRRRGADAATIVAGDPILGGGLAARLPNARIWTPDLPVPLPEARGGGCLLIWRDRDGDAREWQRLNRARVERFGGPRDDGAAAESITAPLAFGPFAGSRRRYEASVVWRPDGLGDCD